MVATIEPGNQVDRYVVERVLGEGGMAVVYRVRHNTLGTSHALKVLTIGNKGIQQRLVQEGRVQATLRHPNVVAVTDVLVLEGAPALLMEFIEGPSLDGLLHHYRPTVAESVALFRGIVAGVRHAHGKGLIHRDLKPANVMLDTGGDGILPKVTDFGLAKAVEGESAQFSKTRTGTTMGTPSYMPPEQIRDASKVDKRADVYSLGAVLFELVCGRPPFVADDIITLLTAVAAGQRPDPKSFDPNLPDSIVTAIERAMHPDPNQRAPDCDAILAILDADPALPRTGDAAALGANGTLAVAVANMKAATPAPAGPRSQPTWAGASDAGGSESKAPKVDLLASDVKEVTSPRASKASRTPEPRAGVPTMVAPPPSQAPARPSKAPVSVTSMNTMSVPPPTSNRGVIVVAGLIVAMVSLVAAIAVGVAVATTLNTGAATPQVVVVPMNKPGAPPAAPVGAAIAPVEATPDPSVAATPGPGPEESPKPKPKPADKPDKPADKPDKPAAKVGSVGAGGPAPATGAVKLAGDATRVLLVQGNKEYSPGDAIPVGTWQIKAWFDGPEPVSAGKVTVKAGETATVKCSAMMFQCKVQ